MDMLFLDPDWVTRERDPRHWPEPLCDDPDALLAWRAAGFVSSQAAGWVGFLDKNYGSVAWTNEEQIAIASSWIVAGFDPQGAHAWMDVLDFDEDDTPATARSWAGAGFSPERAEPWLEREDVVDAAAYENAGWTFWQRDLLAVLLDEETAELVHGGPVDDLGLGHLRHDLRESGFAPGRVLDFVRAGLPFSDWPVYERLMSEGVAIDTVLSQFGSRVERSYESRYRAEQIYRVEPGTVRAFHQHPYWSDVPDLHDMRHEPQAPLVGWPGPELVETWAENGGVRVERYGYGDFDRPSCPEDYALEPRLDWDEVQEKLVLDAFQSEVEADELCEIEWPPAGSLWAPGYATEPVGDGCDRHEWFEAHCFECTAPTGDQESEPAEFRWYITVRTYAKNQDGELDEIDSDHVHIMSTFLDPRSVEYSEFALR
ncbi:hypothetical protein ABIE44_002723 [Marmoricola sp. OAE513]|uniref:hypothetical protein n=1 Tax=Marmoricola sp. OAE513 TaxID=2817894 RepID=UPI001AE5E8A7